MSLIKKIFKDKEKDSTTKKSDDSVATQENTKKESKEQEKIKTPTKDKFLVGIKKSVIKNPWVSEKSRDILSNNQYVFLVNNDANKNSIKEEVERKWSVKVLSVNIIRKGIRPKKFAGRPGKTRVIKKAMVTLKEGDKIDIYPV
ncbi:MAG: 50S ribosomal protein L23 [Candidatus Paceibacterota bacterium]